MHAVLKINTQALPAPPEYKGWIHGPRAPIPERLKKRTPHRRTNADNYGYTPDQDKVIYTMRKAGFSYAQIGAEIGKTANAVRKHAAKRWGKEVEVDRYQNRKGKDKNKGSARTISGTAG